MAQAPDVGDRNFCTSLQPRFAAMASGSGERLLFARGFSGGARGGCFLCVQWGMCGGRELEWVRREMY
ncbi:hypothetical protein A4S05_23625 [Nostoc sp. KVJ20]|uniref:hypothetical protein n=1 Tax=Nostoc sp. KVJ20 TaxID=457944 RepID=UPI00083CF2D5|nr:hypothetical protein [Nostoc sp. KVJ20]ODH02562.1 hypothetical protein A4S05_23625 [Nostoc sp. KVJ20]